MSKPDYSNWFTKQQAADAIGCSTKTVEHFAAKGQIQHGFIKRLATGVKISVYHPDDVNRIRKERNPDAEPFTILETAPDERTADAPLVKAPVPGSNPEGILAMLSAMLPTPSQASQNGHVRTAEKLFLTITEASEYSGLPQSYIRQAMKDSKLDAMKTGSGWRIRRTDLEKL